MELTFSKQPVLLSETLLDTAIEQPVECDMLLPDYCPNIVKVLRCEVQTAITSAQVTGGKLGISATSVVRVFYLGESAEIRSSEQRLTHNRSVELKALSGVPAVEVRSRTRYLNCRAVSERRFEVRGAIEFVTRVTDRREEQLLADSNSPSLQMRKEMATVSELAACVSRGGSVREELELPAGKPSVYHIIRSSAYYRLLDCKVMAGKVVTKGELLLHLLYQPQGEDAAAECMEYTLPVSQILDVDRADENCRCYVSGTASSIETTVRSDVDGDCRTIGLEAGLTFQVSLYREKQVALVSDCYSTACETTVRYRSLTLQHLLSLVRESCVYKELLDLPQEIRSIIDLWCEVEDTAVRREEENAVVCLKLKICLFAVTDDDSVAYFDRVGEFEYALPSQACEACSFDPQAGVLSTAYSLSAGGQIEVRAELELAGCLCGIMQSMVVEEVTPDPSRPHAGEDDAALIVYYARQGEEIWEIAKRYNTSPAAILEENGLEMQQLPQAQMLLIPITL